MNTHEIESWKKGRELANEVYNITRKTLFNNDQELKENIRKASLLLISNIAEGLCNESSCSIARFLKLANFFAGDIRSQLYVAMKLNYITKEEHCRVDRIAVEATAVIYGLINHMRMNG